MTPAPLRLHAAQERLRESEQMRARLAAIVESCQDAIVGTDLEGRVLSWNRGAERLYLYTADEVMGRRVDHRLVPEERVAETREILQRITAGRDVEHFETIRLRKDGSFVEVSLTVSPIRDSEDQVVGASCIARDLTERRRADASLRRSEEQLQQAQKMKAIGSLAGGVAHDFNNLLSVILSYTGLAIDQLGPGDPLRVDLEEVLRAGERAAELTRQLLAFSRQQMLSPRITDLDAVVLGMERLLRRLVTEDIELSLLTTPGLGHVSVDPSQLEQVILNLVVNARDAMPAGGKLTLETANVELDADYVAEHLGVGPGPHVMLAVSDTGMGMDAAVRARVFEPFFTTKAQGKGTGLGLSTVFGIVRQSGGNIWLYSEPGRGTTFKIFLPRAEGAVQPPPARRSLPETVRGHETILLVEDDDQVRQIVCAILRRNGYTVLEAQNGGEAFLVCEQFPGAIDALLTDVVMPRMSGRQLAERVASLRPQMKVLYMSGYADRAVVQHGVLEAGISFLQKPVTPETLLRKLRSVIDGAAARSE